MSFNATQVRDANKRIAELLEKSTKAIQEAESIADEYGISFYHSVNGAYGTGAHYTPKTDDDWESSNCYGDDDSGWSSSSQSC